MSNKFNLLSLHTPNDIHSRTWICLKTPKIKNIIKDLEKDILKKQNWSREKLCREMGIQLGCAHTTIKWIVHRKRNFYPIPVILELIKLSRRKKYFLKEIEHNITYLKTNSASAKPVKAVKKLNKNLAKIIGAFMADGSLSIQVTITATELKELYKIKNTLTKLQVKYSTGRMPSRKQYYINIQLNKNNLKILNELTKNRHLIQMHYGIELTEEYKDSVEAFIKWIKTEFNIDPNRFKKRGNAWRVCFSNKILARYLMIFFNIFPGPKTYSAFEPEIIKNSNLSIRKEFAKGVLMFDGAISKERKILLSVVSYNLSSSIRQIWEKDNIKFGSSENIRKCNYSPTKLLKTFDLYTTENNKKEKFLDYFEADTQKWKLFNWLSGDLKQNPILNIRFSTFSEGLIKILQKVEMCDVSFLKNYLNCSELTIRSYLKILEAQNKIIISNKPKNINNYISKDTTVLLKNKYHKLLFNKAREKFKKDKNLANFLGIHKSTFSTWRLKKARMPIYTLREMCKILELDFDKLLKNISRTDRKIIEII